MANRGSVLGKGRRASLLFPRTVWVPFRVGSCKGGPFLAFLCVRPRRSSALSSRRAFTLFLDACPSCARCFAGKLFPLLWRESCHAYLSALASGCPPSLSAHLTHDFGNKVASHSFIL